MIKSREQYRDELPLKQTGTCIPAAGVIRYNASGLYLRPGALVYHRVLAGSDQCDALFVLAELTLVTCGAWEAPRVRTSQT